MKKWNIQDSENIYKVQRWGNGYFKIGNDGHLKVTPKLDEPELQIDMPEIIEEMLAEGIQLPAVIRFHDILRSQVQLLNETFRRVIKEAEYQNTYLGVYPVKVNQMREVVEEIVDAGRPYQHGLEAGSKPELMAALAYNTNRRSLTILNGYKDEDYLRLALLGRQMNRKLVVVIEKYSELVNLIRLSRELGVDPIIGLRAKMMVKGRGKWEQSSGERAKFGLSIAEILNAVELLKKENMLHTAELLHFHIGSQLTDIRSVKEAVQEASLIYSKLYKLGVPLQYVDVGGGLAVDYDGSQSTNDSSKNYSLDEYVSDIVYGFKQTCELEQVPHPALVSESGRALTAHHSCVVTKVIGEIRRDGVAYDTAVAANEHILVTNMRDLHQLLDEGGEHCQEVLNDANQIKEQAMNGFKLGVLELDELAKTETLYWQLLTRISQFTEQWDFVPEELKEISERLSSQYLSNFSVFQSAADSWAIDQVLPIVPLTRLNEKPSKVCSLVDITCDSDGKIDKFIGDESDPIANNIPLHQLNDENYYLGLFLTGAYQDVMGDMHNLFGRLNEVHVFCYDDDPKDFYIEEVVRGSNANQVLSSMQYNPEIMAQMVKKQIDKQIRRGHLGPREGVRWIDFYEDCLSSYTYLKV
ncbi:MAG: biosynthetic arginine decarboxylase [Gammaproteobacteria bacterium]|nr:biosynthetic arginine decarboxylase [Gammaproteobacteria bacterium]